MSDVSDILRQYLQYLDPKDTTVIQPPNIDFLQAATQIRDSTVVYANQVDKLYHHVISVVPEIIHKSKKTVKSRLRKDPEDGTRDSSFHQLFILDPTSLLLNDTRPFETTLYNRNDFKHPRYPWEYLLIGNGKYNDSPYHSEENDFNKPTSRTQTRNNQSLMKSTLYYTPVECIVTHPTSQQSNNVNTFNFKIARAFMNWDRMIMSLVTRPQFDLNNTFFASPTTKKQSNYPFQTPRTPRLGGAFKDGNPYYSGGPVLLQAPQMPHLAQIDQNDQDDGINGINGEDFGVSIDNDHNTMGSMYSPPRSPIANSFGPDPFSPGPLPSDNAQKMVLETSSLPQLEQHLFKMSDPYLNLIPQPFSLISHQDFADRLHKHKLFKDAKHQNLLFKKSLGQRSIYDLRTWFARRNQAFFKFLHSKTNQRRIYEWFRIKAIESVQEVIRLGGEFETYDSEADSDYGSDSDSKSDSDGSVSEGDEGDESIDSNESNVSNQSNESNESNESTEPNNQGTHQLPPQTITPIDSEVSNEHKIAQLQAYIQKLLTFLHLDISDILDQQDVDISQIPTWQIMNQDPPISIEFPIPYSLSKKWQPPIDALYHQDSLDIIDPQRRIFKLLEPLLLPPRILQVYSYSCEAHTESPPAKRRRINYSSTNDEQQFPPLHSLGINQSNQPSQRSKRSRDGEQITIKDSTYNSQELIPVAQHSTQHSTQPKHRSTILKINTFLKENGYLNIHLNPETYEWEYLSSNNSDQNIQNEDGQSNQGPLNLQHFSRALAETDLISKSTLKKNQSVQQTQLSSIQSLSQESDFGFPMTNSMVSQLDINDPFIKDFLLCLNDVGYDPKTLSIQLNASDLDPQERQLLEIKYQFALAKQELAAQENAHTSTKLSKSSPSAKKRTFSDDSKGTKSPTVTTSIFYQEMTEICGSKDPCLYHEHQPSLEDRMYNWTLDFSTKEKFLKAEKFFCDFLCSSLSPDQDFWFIEYGKALQSQLNHQTELIYDSVSQQAETIDSYQPFHPVKFSKNSRVDIADILSSFDDDPRNIYPSKPLATSSDLNGIILSRFSSTYSGLPVFATKSFIPFEKDETDWSESPFKCVTKNGIISLKVNRKQRYSSRKPKKTSKSTNHEENEPDFIDIDTLAQMTKFIHGEGNAVEIDTGEVIDEMIDENELPDVLPESSKFTPIVNVVDISLVGDDIKDTHVTDMDVLDVLDGTDGTEGTEGLGGTDSTDIIDTTNEHNTFSLSAPPNPNQDSFSSNLSINKSGDQPGIVNESNGLFSEFQGVGKFLAITKQHPKLREWQSYVYSIVGPSDAPFENQKFDIQQEMELFSSQLDTFSTQVNSTFSSKKRKKPNPSKNQSARSFLSVVAGQPADQIAKTFCATLQLVNDHKVEILEENDPLSEKNESNQDNTTFDFTIRPR